MGYAGGGLYGRQQGHPTAEEAAVQLTLTGRSVVASARDLRVHAAGTAVGALLGLWSSQSARSSTATS